MKKTILSLLAVAAMSTSVLAADFKPALIYGTGGKFDKSFNESGYTGAEKFKTDTGVAYRDFEPTGDAQGEQAILNFASMGFSPIVALSFAWKSAIEKLAPQFPDTEFYIVDDVVEAPNVQSIVFNEEEGSYLVGLLGAMKSETGTVGFVGGMDIPLIHKFGCGYAQGAHAADPNVKILRSMVGTTGAAWNDPVKAAELTKNQINQSADVIYVAAGASGLGVLQAAADEKKYSIGVDSNQNYVYPGSVLTSMVKRVDNAVYDAFKNSQDKQFKSGVNSLGIAEHGVGWAYDEYNKPLISPEMLAAVEEAKVGIISGNIKIHDYSIDNTCPY